MNIIEILVDSFSKILLPGLKYTIPLTLISFFFGLIIAIISALISVANVKVLKNITRFYIWIFRGTPLLVQIFIIFYGLPKLNILLNPLPAAVIAFSLNVGAYASETIRAAILSIPKGQLEAGYSSGLSYLQIMQHVIVPQALRVSLPPLFNTFISLLKDTSLASNITVAEMFMTTQQIVARTYEPLALYLEVAFIYLIFCTLLSKLQTYLEKKFKIN